MSNDLRREIPTACRHGVQAPAEREAFTSNRELEYFSEKELQAQIGFPMEAWAVALMKELIENGLDASEAHGLRPVVNVEVGDDYFLVEDEGPGIPPEVVASVLDFSTRTSTNSKYVSPTRGQMGNALKCVVAAPAVLFPGKGAVTIEARGVRHHITVRPDAIAQVPQVEHRQEGCPVKTGTSVRVAWPGGTSCGLEIDDGDFYRPLDLAKAVALFNPHARISFGGEALLDPMPLEKWNASEPTSPHWYNVPQLGDLIAAHVHRERQGLSEARSLRDFVRGFAGLTATARAKEVLDAAGLSGLKLGDLARGDGLDREAVSGLLRAMQAAARPVKPKALGAVSEKNWLRGMASLYGVEGGERYCVLRGEAEGRPFVVEAAFGLLPDDAPGRVLRVGLNWAPALTMPLGAVGWALELAEIDDDVSAFVGLHIITPLIGFTDRAKAHVSLPREVVGAVESALARVTREMTKALRRQERQSRQIEKHAREQMLRREKRGMTVKEAAWQVMEEAHAQVTGGEAGAPAQARQLMYAARKRVLELTGGKCWKKSATFTQSYLPDFVAANPELTKGWNVVYDARGHLVEPHGGQVVQLGTVGVRNYVRSWTQGRLAAPALARAEVPRLDELVACKNTSSGPLNRYSFVLLVEKQGFEDLLAHAGIADRFDVAVATTKGLSTTAARELVDALSAQGVTTLVLHDFDRDGLKIHHTLKTSNRRYKFKARPLVVDVGLRLDDAKKMGLDGEPVKYRMEKNPREYLAEIGAKKNEREFLVERQVGPKLWVGRRVELNEMTNHQFIDYLERKLVAAGVKKVVPDEETLRDAWVSAVRNAHIRHAVEQARLQAQERFANLLVDVPDKLGKLVAKRIEGTALSWNEGLALVLREQLRRSSSSTAG
jgi:DNA topoisomerase VI subunit B